MPHLVDVHLSLREAISPGEDVPRQSALEMSPKHASEKYFLVYTVNPFSAHQFIARRLHQAQFLVIFTYFKAISLTLSG